MQPLTTENLTYLNKVVFDYLRAQNEFYQRQRRLFADAKTIDPEGYAQTLEIRMREEKAIQEGKDAHLARLEYFDNTPAVE
jgi:hypothetical protein